MTLNKLAANKKMRPGLLLASFLLLFSFSFAFSSQTANAAPDPKLSANDRNKLGYKDVCGKGKNAVKVKFDFGCIGSSYRGESFSPIHDLAYSLIRFLSVGAGIAVIISIIAAGIRYSTSEGNPEVSAAAKKRIENAMIGLFIYIFTFAILQYLVPGGIFRPGTWLYQMSWLL